VLVVVMSAATRVAVVVVRAACCLELVWQFLLARLTHSQLALEVLERLPITAATAAILQPSA
jgi:hypothetical protein